MQRTLQAMSIAIYRDAPVSPRLRDVAAEAWSLVPDPVVTVEPVQLETLNRFEPTAAFFRTRMSRLNSVVAALDRLERGESIPNRIVTRRYAAGLPTVSRAARARLREQLQRFVA